MKSDIVKIVADKLNYYLEQKNMSIYELAKRSKKTYSSTYRVVHGLNKTTVTFANIEKLADALNVSAIDLITPLPELPEDMDDPPKEQKKI